MSLFCIASCLVSLQNYQRIPKLLRYYVLFRYYWKLSFKMHFCCVNISVNINKPLITCFSNHKKCSIRWAMMLWFQGLGSTYIINSPARSFGYTLNFYYNTDQLLFSIYCIISGHMARMVSANDRRCYICNAFSHWLRPFWWVSARKMNINGVTSSLHSPIDFYHMTWHSK